MRGHSTRHQINGGWWCQMMKFNAWSRWRKGREPNTQWGWWCGNQKLQFLWIDHRSQCWEEDNGIWLWWLRVTGSRGKKKRYSWSWCSWRKPCPAAFSSTMLRILGWNPRLSLALLLQMAPSVHWAPAYCSILALRANPKWWSSTYPWEVRMGEVMERSSTEN